MNDNDKQALLNNTATILSKITIVSNNTEITESNGIISWDYEDFRYVPNEGFIGQFVERQINGQIKNLSDSFIITDEEIQVSFAVKTNTTETWYSLGNFLVSNVSDDEVKDVTTFEAKDYTKKFNQPYEDTIEYPCTALQLAQNVCTQCGVQLGSQSFTNSNYVINGNVFTNGETCRDVMKAIGKLAFSWIRVDWDNKVYIDFTKETTVDTYNKASNSKYYDLKSQKEQFGPVNRIIIGYSQIEGEKTKIEDAESIEENGLCELTIYDNPLVYTQAQRESIINNASGLLGLTYIPCNFETVGHAWLKGKELFEITDMEGNTHNTIPLDRTIKYFGHIKTLINVPTPTKTESTFAYTPQIKDKLGRTEIMVDKLNQIIQSIVENTTNVSNTTTGYGTITLDNAYPGALYRLSIKGQISLLFPQSESNLHGHPLVPSDSLVPSNTLVPSSPVPYGNEILYPSSTLYPKGSKLIIDGTEYKLDFDFLNFINEDVCDEYICENGKSWIVRRVGIDSSGNKYALDNEVIEPRKDITLSVNTNSVITLKSFDGARLTATYLINNIYTDEFATEVELHTEIKQTRDEIDIVASSKVDNEDYNKAEIVARINDNTSQVKINAGEVDISANDVLNILSGNTINLTSKNIIISSDHFNVTANGDMECNNATINGDLVTANGVLTNLIFPCELWSSRLENVYDEQGGGFIGFNFVYGDTIQVIKSFLNFTVRIPEHFTVTSAKIHLRHSPVTWFSGGDEDPKQQGACQNMRAYVTTNLATTVKSAYGSEYNIISDTPTFTPIDEVSSKTFSSSVFEPYSTENFKNTFTSSGTYNISVMTTITTPSLPDPSTAYQTLGQYTGLLNGELEIIGYLKTN